MRRRLLAALLWLTLAISWSLSSIWAQQAAASTASAPIMARPNYVLGPDDQVVIRVLDLDEVSPNAIRIEGNGSINLPLVGRVRAGGLTLQALEASLTERFKVFVKQPQVTVSVAEYRSQPVSVIGAFNAPGVHQIQGRKTLAEIVSLAGGLKNDASSKVTITRQIQHGRIGLSTAHDDATGQFSVAEVDLTELLEGRRPEYNILIEPHDVISVSRGKVIYVLGEVKKAGGFVLQSGESMHALEALAMAEGLTIRASAKHAKILRPAADGGQRAAVAINLGKILSGKAPDVELQADDILFIPDSTARNIGIRAAETALQIGTGVVIFRR